MNENKEPGVEEVDDPEVFEQEPPASEPHDPADDERKPRPRWLAPVIAAVVAVVLVAAGFGGWKIYESRRHESAMADCMQSVKAMRSNVRSAQATLGRYRGAAGIRADQVKDAKTVSAMRRAVKAAGGVKPQVVACDASMSTSDLRAAVGKAGRTSDRLKGIDRDYAKAGKAVLASRDAKSLDDAKSALDGKKDEASKLLGDSDGKVADNAVRDALQQAISQAGQVKGGKAKAYQDAASALQSAMDQVNASVQQKSQADQAAQQQAAQQAAQAQAVQQPARRAAPSYGGGRGGYTPSYRPSYSRGGGGGSAPAPAAPAPAPAAPQGGGVSDDVNNWMHHMGKPVCQPGQACGIG